MEFAGRTGNDAYEEDHTFGRYARLCRTASIEAGHSIEYKLNQKGHGVYLFVVEGRVSAADHSLGRRDGVGIWDADSFYVCAEESAEVLLIEVPML